MKYKCMIVLAIMLASVLAMAFCSIAADPMLANQDAPATIHPPAVMASPTPTVASTLASTPTPLPALLRCVVSVGLLNLRKGPGIEYGVLTVLAENDVLAIVDDSDWALVITPSGVAGWVNKSYVRCLEAK